ncbi:PrsW family intramembrane metalloprotease [Herbiconiux sp. KACC 21604]|uniref:PrsW family intramembrane metalloprotease n=1 Tax=unclassified Herbiconiux TaxID=2618217 RepID=UPI0014928508|nr:PrsW family intramembrane metalloprotease [Herbiconiux sp. SALV-R1]QJU53735.1 PrsW family intramembrane metalloprotease [Herbiconiux sp. SALV-R1]WPO84739.1 PrsW family intramembrane metalloprotease [Herbiconiux sp. KACC 21604]
MSAFDPSGVPTGGASGGAPADGAPAGGASAGGASGASAPAAVQSPAPQAPAAALPATPMMPVATRPRGASTSSLVFGIIGILVLGFVFLAVIAYLVLGLGPVAFVICAIVALVPLAVVITAITLIDRWEPEPRPALWFAFLWGAAASVAIALIADFSIQLIVYAASDGLNTTSELWGSVIQAPVVEEGAKAAGILILLLFFRKQFDGPVDGLVYGATIAAGFAFTENILYFGQSLIESGGIGLGFTFVLRGIMSPFAHVMFTACTGVALGFAVRRRNWLAGAGIFVLGLLLAIGLHALWNGSTYLVEGLGGFFLLYLVVQVPLFALAVVFVVLLRRAETRLTRARLQEYAAAGWFSPAEVDMLSTGTGRRQAKTWARTLPPGGSAAMKSFMKHATRLAFVRQRMLVGRSAIGPRHDEAQLLDELLADRAALGAVLQARGV